MQREFLKKAVGRPNWRLELGDILKQQTVIWQSEVFRGEYWVVFLQIRDSSIATSASGTCH